MNRERKFEISVMFITAFIILFSLVSYAQPDAACPGGEHEYVSTLLTPATETEQGEVQNTCIHCGDVYTEYLPATGHTFGEWETAQEGTKGGRLERRICTKCGRSEGRWVPVTAVVRGAETPGTKRRRANSMDYILTTATTGVWGYAALVLWWNSLVLIWYKKECEKKKRERQHDIE